MANAINAINALTNVTNTALDIQSQWNDAVAAATKLARRVDRETAKAALAPIVAAKRGGEWDASEGKWVDANGRSQTAKKWLNRWLATIYGKDESRVAPKKDEQEAWATKYFSWTPAEQKRALKKLGVL